MSGLCAINSMHLNKVINERFQSHFSDNALMILNYDGLESPMIHTKFRGNRPAGSGVDGF